MLIVCICPGLGFKCIIPSYKHPEEISGEEFCLSCTAAKHKLERS